MKRNKKILLSIGAASILAVTGLASTIAVLNRPLDTPAQSGIVSKKDTIVLKNAAQLGSIKDGTEVQGTYSKMKNQALFYTVTDEKKKLLGSGTILPNEKGQFSRNLAFMDAKSIKSGTKVSLNIYAQTNKGKITDQLALATRYQ